VQSCQNLLYKNQSKPRSLSYKVTNIHTTKKDEFNEKSKDIQLDTRHTYMPNE